MRPRFTEKNIVVILFIMVFITFSLAQEDSKKMEKLNSSFHSTTISPILVHQPVIKAPVAENTGKLSSPGQAE